MFSPKLNSSQAKFSPFTQGKDSRPNRRSSNRFTPQRRLATRSQHGQSADHLGHHTSISGDETSHGLQTYGAALPVLVTEALTLADRSLQASVRLDPSGWAWLVCGRRLFVWKYKPSPLSKSSQCKELTLPPSDLAHSARLVCVLGGPADNVATVGCVAVSPEGIVRYWSNLAHAGSFVEISADLKGEEGTSLITLQWYNCILATTTSTLLLLSPAVGQNVITCRLLHGTQGMFASIGRRVSSLFFGTVTTNAMPAHLQAVLAGEVMEQDSQAVYMLSGSNLNKWLISSGTEKLLYQCDVETMLRECVAQTIWKQDAEQLTSLKTWLLDMETTRDGVVILGAAVNSDVSQRVYYVLGTLHTEGADPPQSFLSFTVARFEQMYQEGEEDKVLSYRLLLPHSSQASAYMYDSSAVICLSVSNSTQPLDKVDFHSPGDKLLGAGSCDGLALFFSTNHGLVSVSPTNAINTSTSAQLSMQDTTMDSSVRLESSIVINASQIDELSVSEDKASRLKASFLHFCSNNLPQAQAIVHELFPASEDSAGLDRMMAQLSQELIDDYPASDPRWAESVPHDAAASCHSLILLHQLEDKQRAHEYLVSFTKNLALWDRMSVTVVRDILMSTRLLLCEHAEKLVAAMTLRGLHTQYPALVDAVIRRVLEIRGIHSPPAPLTPQDVFYRQVSGIHELLVCLADYQKEKLASDITPMQTVELITAVNSIFEGMLQAACQYRQSKWAMYQSQAGASQHPHYVPWTSSLGSQGLRSLLTKQHGVTIEVGLGLCKDLTTRGVLLQQLVVLTDLVLDGYKLELESLQVDGPPQAAAPQHSQLLHQYEEQRFKLISPFMELDQYDRAASLAEKYCDFAVLVQLCEETNNEDRLHRYLSQFHNQGFADFLFKWYVKHGKRGKLMSSSLAQHPELACWLQTGEHQYLSWLHNICANNFYQAHCTLKDLALKETALVAKKKTLLSLSKLAAIATDDAPEDLNPIIEEINEDHDLILHQELLPQEVVESLAMEAENMRVLTPVELIKCYVGTSNATANEHAFKKALDLLQFLDKDSAQPNYASLRLHIWCRAILVDDWTGVGTTDPLEHCRNTVFFKTVELAYTEGQDVRDFLPNVDELLASDELKQLQRNKQFQYLIRAGYEHIHKVLS